MNATGVRTFLGGDAAREPWPARAVGFSLRLADGTLAIETPPLDAAALATADVVLAADAGLCRRTFGIAPSVPANFRLSDQVRAIGLSIRDCHLPDRAKQAFRFAKSIELLCLIFQNISADGFLPAGAGKLSELDARRIMTARRIIDEHWREKLTLASIARASGLNRAKLTRGFRSMFACSVADAIAERRMAGARDLVLATDLPISCIGYRCGYLNNASFARAFSRRFGLAPTRLRADRIAA